MRHATLSGECVAYLPSVLIVIWVTPDAKMPIHAGPSLRNLKWRIVGVQFPLVLFAFADLVERELLYRLLGAVATQQHLNQLIYGGLLRDQKALVFRLQEANLS